MADQGVSSLSNFALGIVLARSLPAAEFGAFSLAYVTYAFILSGARGIATDPLLVRFSGSASERWRTATAASTATAAALGLVAGVVCILVGVAMPARVGGAFIALGVGLPALMWQDSWRFAFFSVGQAAKALVNDLVWGLLLLTALVALMLTGHANVVACMLAFGATAALAGLVGLVQSRVRPRPRLIRAWVVDHRDLGTRYLVENLSIGAARQVRFFLLGAVAGLAAVGETRAAEILMGPFLVILMGTSQVAVPEAVHVLERAPHRLERFCLGLGAVLATAAAVWGIAVMALLGTGLGQLLLGPIWVPASKLLLPVMINLSLAAFTIAATAGVRALGAARRSLTAQSVNAVLYAAGGGLGAFVDGAAGSCWGVAAATGLGNLVWWLQLRRGVDDHLEQRRSETETIDTDRIAT